MFGYVTFNQSEMKFREYDEYHAYYCGLCESLKDHYGYKGQISLNNDLTFLALLLSSLYESTPKKEESRCIVHPMHKHLKYSNEYIDYCASMTIVLTYFKCQDDWVDEKKVTRKLYMSTLNNSFHKIKDQFPNKVDKIKEDLDKSSQLEKENCTNIDEISRYSGLMMGEICAYKDDEWHDELFELGFYLGKFIYLMDAYDDIEKDLKNDCFNPFKEMYKEENFDENCYNLLEMMISKSATAFECLPIIENVEILRNILYSGVWTKFDMIKKKREEDASGSL